MNQWANAIKNIKKISALIIMLTFCFHICSKVLCTDILTFQLIKCCIFQAAHWCCAPYSPVKKKLHLLQVFPLLCLILRWKKRKNWGKNEKKTCKTLTAYTQMLTTAKRCLLDQHLDVKQCLGVTICNVFLHVFKWKMLKSEFDLGTRCKAPVCWSNHTKIKD